MKLPSLEIYRDGLVNSNAVSSAHKVWKTQILYDLRFKKKNSKDACESDDQLRQDIENDKLYEELSKSKLDLRLDLDIQTFENQC